MSARITKRTVDAMQTSDRDQFVWDSEIRGFGVKLTPANRRVFVLCYRFPRGRAGRVKRYALGAYGSITADEARNIAKRLVGEIAAGIDPMAALQAKRKAADAERRAPQKSFEIIAKRFIEQHHKAHNRHWKEAERLTDMSCRFGDGAILPTSRVARSTKPSMRSRRTVAQPPRTPC